MSCKLLLETRRPVVERVERCHHTNAPAQGEWLADDAPRDGKPLPRAAGQP